MTLVASPVAAVVAAVILIPLLAVASLTGGNPACLPDPGLAPATNVAANSPAVPPQPGQQPAEQNLQWNAEQTANAATIVAVGKTKAVPAWGWVIAVATAMQESRLRNLPGGDRDSIGLFQQRPSQGWGTPAQLASPTYQAARFYDALLAVPDWQHLPLTQAAQQVQRSAFPLAYTQWTQPAITLVNQLSATTPIPASAIPTLPGTTPAPSGSATGCGAEADGLPAALDVQLPAGFVLPPGTPPQAAAAIGWALQQLGAPYSWGGDCTAPHGPDPAHQCDCSSLVQAAYQHAGITLPRTTTQQVTAGIPIHDPAQLQPGDLIFIPGSLGTVQHPRHVGLYIGGPDGLIVHAPAPGRPTRLAMARQWKIAVIRRVAVIR